jgi:plastocyanin
MGPTRIAVAVAICLGMGLYAADAPGQGRGSAARRTAGPAVVVKMVGDQLVFNPPSVVIRRGQTVEWQDQSNQLHNIVDDAAKATNKADVALPKGASPFDSGFLKPGQSYSHRFTVRGTYRYVCTLHEVQGMKGEIVVK